MVDRNSMVTRRAALTSSVMLLFPGCSTGEDRSEIRVVAVRIGNHRREDRTVTVTVEKDGELVTDATVDVPAASDTERGHTVVGNAFIDPTWDDATPGEFTIETELADTAESGTLRSEEVADSGEFLADIRIERNDVFYAVWRACDEHLC